MQKLMPHDNNQTSPRITVCALYHFVPLANFAVKRAPLQALMLKLNIRGTILLSHEGINGTVAGGESAIESLLDWLKKDKRLAKIKWQVSFDKQMPFYRTKVKLKKEIVTLGQPDTDPLKAVGSYVKPEDWNALIEDPDVILVDTRNNYEVEIGTFKNALNPKTTTFREFPAYVEQTLEPSKNKKVAMFCTGGIRCEKSTAYLKARGFTEVYHLEGGILKYLAEVPEAESLWQGECFVFDNRVSVNHQLESGDYAQCHACRMPITKQDAMSHDYQPGISCPHCIHNQSERQKSRFQEREKQVRRARLRGEAHIGADAAKAQGIHKQAKHLARVAKSTSSKA